MNFQTAKIEVPQWLVLVGILIILAAGLGYWFYTISDAEVKLIGLLGGVVSGLVVFVLTFVTLLRPLQRLDQYEKMGVKALLQNRHDKAHYEKIVSGAGKQVRVMGASCTRFVEDFLDRNSEENKVLVDALRQNGRLFVHLLVPLEKYMAKETKARAQSLEAKILDLQTEFGNRVELRRFPERAQHSFVIVDNELIAGPIFESDKSKYAPAVHVLMSTSFAQKYEHHFEDVWNACAVTD